jgi:hypothetical protein
LVTADLPSQLGGSAEEKEAVKGMAGAIDGAASTIISGGIVVNLLMASSMNLLWGMVNVLQVVANLSKLNVMLPSNARMFFDALLATVNLDILPLEGVNSVLFPFLYKKKPGDPLEPSIDSRLLSDEESADYDEMREEAMEALQNVG